MSEAIHHLEDYASATRWRATVVSSERITPEASPEVRELVLEVDRPDSGAVRAARQQAHHGRA